MRRTDNGQTFGKTLGLSSMLGLALAISPAAQALETDFDLFYRATAFAVQSDSFDNDSVYGSDGDNGLAHVLRLGADFRDEETGIEIHTSIELAGDRWNGDNRAYTPVADRAYNTGSKGDNVRLDLGYVQVPLGKTILRIGRQASNYSNCFLVCDDRRDRIIALRPIAGFTALALYDRRADTASFFNQDNGDMVSVGAIGKPGGWDLGLLYVHWFKNYSGDFSAPGQLAEPEPTPYALENVDLVSIYTGGSVAGLFDLTAGFTWAGNGEAALGGNGPFFNENAWAEYVRVEKAIGPMELGLQWVGVQDGGLVSPGYDTYLSLVNNNPDSTANPTSMYRMGGSLGVECSDESLVAGKLTYNLTSDVALSAALGHLSIDNADGEDDSSMVYDLQASCQVNKTVRTWVTLGLLEENDAGILASNTLVGPVPNGGAFAEDDVMAGSLNMTVNF